jgi:hypothetical protein
MVWGTIWMDWWMFNVGDYGMGWIGSELLDRAMPILI